ncbi:hypothetical protein NC652_010125 [Populus alba x Populus x berolinensis]|nr:hypothetical protein NC652_010125 [Populus alba x Populus x berolinensis]
MKGRTHCLNDFVFVFPQIPNLFGFWWLAVSGVEQHIQIDIFDHLQLKMKLNVCNWNTVLNHLQLKIS